MRILVIEDEKKTASFIRKALQALRDQATKVVSARVETLNKDKEEAVV